MPPHHLSLIFMASKFCYDPHRKDSVIAAENTKDLVLELKTSHDFEYGDDRPGHDQERRDLERVYDNKIAKTMLELQCMKINYAPYMIREQVIPFVRASIWPKPENADTSLVQDSTMLKGG